MRRGEGGVEGRHTCKIIEKHLLEKFLKMSLILRRGEDFLELTGKCEKSTQNNNGN